MQKFAQTFAQIHFMSELRTPQFGAILFRATELIGLQGGEVFDSLGFRIPASQISIALTLSKFGPCSSTQLSNRIGISRQLIESRLKKSVKQGLFVAIQDKQDSRKKLYDFSDATRDEAIRITEIMSDFQSVYGSLWQEIGVDIEQALLLMEKALNKSSLEERLLAQFPHYDTHSEEKKNV